LATGGVLISISKAVEPVGAWIDHWVRDARPVRRQT